MVKLRMFGALSKTHFSREIKIVYKILTSLQLKTTTTTTTDLVLHVSLQSWVSFYFQWTVCWISSTNEMVSLATDQINSLEWIPREIDPSETLLHWNVTGGILKPFPTCWTYHWVMSLGNISNTRDSVSSDFQTPRRELKVGRVAECFWRNSRCLEMGWNTVSSVWYIFSNETKTKE